MIHILRFFFIFFILFFNKSILSNTIATIDIDFILNNTKSYVLFLDSLSLKKNQLSKDLENTELLLIKNKEKIDNYSSILNESEINKKIIEYNNELNIYKSKLDAFNEYLSLNISKNQDIVINLIQEIVKEYALLNSIDLILEKNNYFISSDNIDISNYIIDEIKKKDIKLTIID